MVVAKPISAGRPIRWLPSTTRCSRNSLGPGSTNDHLDSLQPIGRSRAPSGRTQRGGHLVGDRPGELARLVEVGAQPLLGGRDVDGGDDVSTETGAETPTRPGSNSSSTDAYPCRRIASTWSRRPANVTRGGGGQSATLSRIALGAEVGVAWCGKWSHHRVIVSLSQALSSVRPADVVYGSTDVPSQPIPRNACDASSLCSVSTLLPPQHAQVAGLVEPGNDLAQKGRTRVRQVSFGGAGREREESQPGR